MTLSESRSSRTADGRSEPAGGDAQLVHHKGLSAKTHAQAAFDVARHGFKATRDVPETLGRSFTAPDSGQRRDRAAPRRGAGVLEARWNGSS